MTMFDFSDEAEATNNAFADEIASLEPLTSEQLDEVLPEQMDKDNFDRLKAIIDENTTEKEKFNKLKENFSDLGGIVSKLLLQNSVPGVGGIVVKLLGKLVDERSA